MYISTTRILTRRSRCKWADTPFKSCFDRASARSWGNVVETQVNVGSFSRTFGELGVNSLGPLQWAALT